MIKLWNNKVFWTAVPVVAALLLSFVRLIHLGEGGDVTFLSMLVLCLVGYYYGPVYGYVSCLVFGVVKLVLDMHYGLALPENLVAESWDYILGYGLLGTVGLLTSMPERKLTFRRAFTVAAGLRFIEGIWNCYIFYDPQGRDPLQNLWYSVMYAFGYIGIEYVLSAVLLMFPVVVSSIDFSKHVATTPMERNINFL